MSGGHFDYQQYHLNDIAMGIKELIGHNGVKNEDGYGYDFNNKTIKEFKTAIELLEKAAVYVQRIDWLISGDDGEDTFHERLKEDLNDNSN